MDIVYLQGLKIETLIGVYAWERRLRQIVVLDLEMSTDLKKAAASDRIADALDYKAVADRVRAFVAAAECQLIETLAEQVARIVITEFGVERLKLKVNKPGAIRDAGGVGVVLERTRQDYA